MSIIKEIKEMNSKQFNYTYSDAGFYIKDCNGNEYEEAYDPIDIHREYSETDKPIEGEINEREEY